jgi:hypothetical protein
MAAGGSFMIFLVVTWPRTEAGDAVCDETMKCPPRAEERGAAKGRADG